MYQDNDFSSCMQDCCVVFAFSIEFNSEQDTKEKFLQSQFIGFSHIEMKKNKERLSIA